MLAYSIYQFSSFLSFFFSIVVDPTNLSEGLHYYELYGVDCKAPWRGPLFRIPITITKPIAVISRPPLYSFSRMSFLPGMCTFSWLSSLFLVTSSFICSEMGQLADIYHLILVSDIYSFMVTIRSLDGGTLLF